jgi:hypothetical protein
MKRAFLLLSVLCVSFVSVAWAQQPATKPPVGKNWHLRHPMVNQMPRTSGVTVSQSLKPQANLHEGKTWELRTYSGGTWAALDDISDVGVAVGVGDVPPIGSDGVGYTHSLAVSLFGPNAGEWIDLGTLGGEQSRGSEEPCITISNTGLVATHSTALDGQVHAVAWTKESGMVDLGTLADTGDPNYSSHNSSYACTTNKPGTLIVGSSGVDGVHNTPVAWTPSRIWKNGEFVTKWKIHKLDTAGLPDVPNWDLYGVNDYGQITAMGYTDNDSIVLSVLWNPRGDGKGWEPTTLLPSRVYPKSFPFHINDSGQITGIVTPLDESTWIPVLWQPLDANRTKHSRPIQLAVPKGFTGCESVGINELGDITGDCWNDTDWLPVHWNAKDPSFSEFINFPGDWGYSWEVNGNRTAVFTYGGGENCPADTYGSCGGAIQLH